MTEQPEHRFTGMHAEPNGKNGTVQWRGTCACGHEEQWVPDKDLAMKMIAVHFHALMEEAARPARTAARFWSRRKRRPE